MMKATVMNPLFDLGNIMATPGAMRAMREGDLPRVLGWHCAGLWGDLDAEDMQANDDAVAYGNRILSAYNLREGVKVWVITEADRSATTILLPEEY